MCTVSWIHTRDGYQMLCNRDELDTRLRAEEPRLFLEGSTRYVAPTDGNFGGTWILVNEHGLTIALLNREAAWARPSRSRGYLARELARYDTVDAVQDSLRRKDLSPFDGFRMVAVQPGRPARVFEWDGARFVTIRNADHLMPLTSSSFDAEGVARSRGAELSERINASGGASAEVLLQFHQSHGLHGDHPSAYSTCMHRPGAATVSFAWVEVAASEVKFFYSPAAPCRWEPGQSLRLERKAQVAVACG